MRATLFLAAALLPASLLAQESQPEISAADAQRIAEYLAQDSLEGRKAGTPGESLAAAFIAQRFERHGLKPAYGQNYISRFEVPAGVELAPKAWLKLSSAKYDDHGLLEDYSAVTLPAADTTFFPFPFSENGAFAGEVVFAGYGMRGLKSQDGDRDYDSYAGLEVKGRVVVALLGTPANQFPQSPHAQARFKAILARELGAKALILLGDTAQQKIAHPNNALEGAEPCGIPVYHADLAWASLALIWPIKDWQASLDRLEAVIPAKAAERWLAEGESSLLRKKALSFNVTGMLPPKGVPHDSAEWVVVGGHHDHLGWGGHGSRDTSGGRQIHNGADDNASGIAAVLEIAEAWQGQNPHRRGLIFCTFGGEELGLLGAKAWLREPPVAKSKIAAMLNFDMVGRLGDTLVLGGSSTASDWESALREASQRIQLPVVLGGGPSMGGSDHMAFHAEGIPALFFFTGLHDDYHMPSDDAEKLNAEGMARIARLGFEIAQDLAQAPVRPSFVAPMAGPRAPEGGGRVAGASLGTIPDYAQPEGLRGVRISGARPGSAAEKAGMQAGDVIVGFNGAEIGDIYDLVHALKTHKPGDRVTVIVERKGQRVELEAVLEASRGR